MYILRMTTPGIGTVELGLSSLEDAKLKYVELQLGGPDDETRIDKLQSENPAIIAKCHCVGTYSGSYFLEIERV